MRCKFVPMPGGGTAVIELADGKEFFSEALNDGTPALAIIDAVCAAVERNDAQ